METVRIKCEADMYTEPLDDGFTVEVKVSVSPTFFGWVFGFAGKSKYYIRGALPPNIKDN